jgi:uncharacterized protein YbcC (UPF0753/DUF2309 family)
VSNNLQSHHILSTPQFDETQTLHRLRHYLPAQAPLKDFIHHNTLHAFQHLHFFEALQQASAIFGYKTILSLNEFREYYHAKKIDEKVLDAIIIKNKGAENAEIWKNKLLEQPCDGDISGRIGRLRKYWKEKYAVKLDKTVQANLFRLVSSYLDQGVAIWRFPVHPNGFWATLQEMDKNSFAGLFEMPRAKALLHDNSITIKSLLDILVGDETLYKHYLFDQQFTHPGWAGMAATLEMQPQSLFDKRAITLKEFILIELLLEIDLLDQKFGDGWKPLASVAQKPFPDLFDDATYSELFEVLTLWQQAFEWTFYNQVLAGVQAQAPQPPEGGNTERDTSFSDKPPLGVGGLVGGLGFQAIFCIDDRASSIRMHIERIDNKAQTFGTAGFFGVEFYYQPINGKFYNKLCPAPLNPKFLVKEVDGHTKKQEIYLNKYTHSLFRDWFKSQNLGFKPDLKLITNVFNPKISEKIKEVGGQITKKQEVYLEKHTHSLFRGWFASQILGLTSGLKLITNIFNPKISEITNYSFRYLDKKSKLQIEYKPNIVNENAVQSLLRGAGGASGFSVEEMAERIETLLKSIGLISNFASIVYIIGHGATSANNTHYAGYDCGACSGRPGSVNAAVAAFMANHTGVRKLLSAKGIQIPENTQFIAAIHDTTRDEIMFYNDEILSKENLPKHHKYLKTIYNALEINAKERARRFDTLNIRQAPHKVHQLVKKRSVSLFEPVPELNHATNALCIVGRREMSKHLFLDRRAFLNSYNYTMDEDGAYLFGILKAVAPVCGGINLEYYFSKVDNYKLGAGTKLPHNVMGLIGVANGVNGDLKTGLPSQMVALHDPVRLMVIVEHYPEVVLNTIKKSAETYEWFKNEWIRLAALNPADNQLYVFEKERFTIYHPIDFHLQKIDNLEQLFEKTRDNIPVSVLE